MSATLTSTNEPFYLKDLNAPQREAVETLDGPLLVLAGAGTGKTRVLTTRLAHLLYQNKAYPSQILAVTFTNKAAAEMRERVAALCGQPVEGWALGTFHGLAARMLRKHAELVGLTSSFTILDADDQVRLMKQLMEAENLDTKKWVPKAMLSVVERWKDRAKRPEDIGMSEAGDLANGRLPALYRMYQERLKTLNACDFGDLLLHMITIFRNPAHADILQSYRDKYKYIMVDEYQDTNVAQYLWLRLLAQGNDNICCVGDDDQSIYGWRGAEVGNILRFEKDFKDAKVIRLEENYRSTNHILAAASHVISHNQGRLGKTLWSKAEEGEKIRVKAVWDADAEARYVGEEIEALQHKGYPLNQIAVLVRASFQMRELEEKFNKLGIPHRIIGGPRFYERAEIRDALAYLRVVAQPADDLALGRIINLPKRGIGGSTVKQIEQHARLSEISMYHAMLDMGASEELRPNIRTALEVLGRQFEHWRNQIDRLPPAELAAMILDESGYTAMWQAEKGPDAQGRLENLKELVSGMHDYESLREFLEYVALVMENQQEGITDQVTLMTLHAAKGLEFDAVFLTGWEDGLFPSQRSMGESGAVGLEEERRLAYVGITRARKKATITYAANRMVYGNWMNALPSRFIDELPENAVEVESENGLYKSGSAGTSQWGATESRYRRDDNFQRSFTPNRALLDRLSAGRSTKQEVVSSQPQFRRGDKVLHDKYGEGEIINVSGNKLDILFADGETKRLLSSFVTHI
ncbi:MAG: ATP-dependent helicase [Pseudobdellovibrionaceae bacterium]